MISVHSTKHIFNESCWVALKHWKPQSIGSFQNSTSIKVLMVFKDQKLQSLYHSKRHISWLRCSFETVWLSKFSVAIDNCSMIDFSAALRIQISVVVSVYFWKFKISVVISVYSSKLQICVVVLVYYSLIQNKAADSVFSLKTPN